MPAEIMSVIVAVLLLAMVGVAVFFATLVRPWLRAVLYGTPVPLICIIAMRLRGNPPLLLVDSYIALHRSGVEATIREIEDVYVDCRNRISNRDDLVELVKKRHFQTADQR